MFFFWIYMNSFVELLLKNVLSTIFHLWLENTLEMFKKHIQQNNRRWFSLKLKVGSDAPCVISMSLMVLIGILTFSVGYIARVHAYSSKCICACIMCIQRLSFCDGITVKTFTTVRAMSYWLYRQPEICDAFQCM